MAQRLYFEESRLVQIGFLHQTRLQAIILRFAMTRQGFPFTALASFQQAKWLPLRMPYPEASSHARRLKR